MKEIPILDNRSVFRNNLKFFLISLFFAAWKLINGHYLGAFLSIALWGILAGIFLFFGLLAYALKARHKLNLSLASLKDVLGWALSLTYYAWSFTFLGYVVSIEDLIQTAFHRVPPLWVAALVLFAFWFVQFLILFYMVYRGRTKDPAQQENS